MRVLVVEDEASIRFLICNLLEEAGFDCREADDAAAASALLNADLAWEPDSLVTDYNLGPGPNGADVAAEAERRLPGIPVIYATGNPECITDPGPRERIIAKPFAIADLIQAIEEITALPGVRQPTRLPEGSNPRGGSALLAA